MTKKEERAKKKIVREQIINILDSECGQCKYKSVSFSRNGICSKCPVGKTLQSLNNSIMDKPKLQHKMIKEYNKGVWSEEEEQYLINHYMMFDILHLAQKLNRPPRGIERKATMMGLNKDAS
ncbi:hypothetical protein ACSVDA_21400 [Cytobacillus sp. Hm23]